MPRIRKKTSKRGTIAQRERIRHKATETRKKVKKAAKKDVTWKSKKSKDPGIPNNFPYKDQILAEIAEERRQTAEAKERRKEEKKALRAQQKAGLGTNEAHGGDDSGDENADADATKDGFDGVATFDGGAKTLLPVSKSKKIAGGTHGGAAPAIEEEASGAPPLMNPELPHLGAVLDKADVVIEILDARDPLAHRSKALETHVSLKEGQRLLLVLNKIDGCPREPTAAWAAHLRAEHPTLLFRAASSFLPPVVRNDPTKGKGKAREPSDDAWGLDAAYALLGRWAHEKAGDGPLRVAVVGLTNSGKSAFVNSLARKTTLAVYAPSSSPNSNSPTTTPYALEVTLEINGKPVVFVDTPGLAWQPSEDMFSEEGVQHRAQDILLRNKGRIDHLKDPIPAVSYIVSRAETEDLMVHYCLPAIAKGDVDAFLMAVARANALIKKGGDPDLVGAARLVLRDWSTGKLARYAVPPPSSARQAAVDGDPTLAAAADGDGDGDAALLERLVPRKELRRSRDVVRLSSGRVDERALAFDAPWFGSATAAATESEPESDAEMEAAASAEEEEDEDEDEDESAESDVQQQQASVPDDDDVEAAEAEDHEHVNTESHSDGDGNEREALLGTTTTSSARKRKLPPSSSKPKPHVDPARPNKKKKVAFAVGAGAAKTVPGLLPRQGQAPASTKNAAAAPVTAADKKPRKNKMMTTPDLARAPAAAPKIGVGLSRAPGAAQGTAARRTGSIKPAANAPTAAQKKRKDQASRVAASEEGVYDFSKFF